MKITILGTGTSFVDPERVQSGVLVEADGQVLLLDIGSGVLHRLTQTNLDPTSLDALFISHFHIDHCSDFATLYQTLWMSKYEKALQVFAAPYVTDWSRGIFDIAFTYLRDRIAIDVTTLSENDVVHIGPVIVTTSPTTHGSMDSRAFRVEAEGKSLVYSSDTAPCKEVVDLAKDADILIHECNWLDGPHPEGVHTSPSELALIVEKAAPRKVILTHMAPEVVKNEQAVVKTVGRRSEAEVILGKDLMKLEL